MVLPASPPLNGEGEEEINRIPRNTGGGLAMEWYFAVLQKYAVFEGRAGRQEFWWFTLINFMAALGLAAVDSVVFGGPLMYTLYCLAMLIPSIAVGVRRLQDTGRNGLWLLALFVPFIGFLVLLFFFVQESQEGANEFGPEPPRELRG
jgi:uncharacterized membrane protein YhaH (DUF805 family)